MAIIAAACVAGCRARASAPSVPPSADPALIPKLDPMLALPKYPVPSPNGYQAFEELVKKVDQTHHLRGDSISGQWRPPSREAELAAAPAQLADNREALQELGPALQVEWLYPRAPAAAMIFPELSKGRYVGPLLRWEAALKAQQGDVEAARQELGDVLTFSVKLQRGGSDMHWLVSLALQQIAFTELRDLIANHRLSQQALASVSQQLTQLEGQQVPLREIIAFDYERQGPQSLNLSPEEFAKLLANQSKLPLPLSVALKLGRARSATQTFISQRLPDLMEEDAKIAELSQQPYYAIRSQIPKQSDQISDMLVLRPFMASLLPRQAQSQAAWRGTQVMVALELHRAEHGAYPDRLADLKALPQQTAEDPFSGKPFIYKHKGPGYLLYSVGVDGKDDGGRHSDRLDEAGTDDVVWPRPPSPRK